MQISRITMITLGVGDLAAATRFYEAVLAAPANTSYGGVTFFELPGAWLALYPRTELARDISPTLPVPREGFSGVTLAHNARSREEVIAVISRAGAAGAHIMKEPRDTFWGGFSGYFADPDGHCWEVAWGPMFEFTAAGDLRFKDSPAT